MKDFIVIAENINTTRKHIEEYVAKRDSLKIKDLAVKLKTAGANYLEINSGRIGNEIDDISWLIKEVQIAVDLPLCIDSPNPEVLEEALKIYDFKAGSPILNSATFERMDKIFSLAKKYNTKVICLLSDVQAKDDKIKLAKEMVGIAKDKYNIENPNLFFDPGVFPLSVSPENVLTYINTLSEIKLNNNDFAGVNTVGGLSNVSIGLKPREPINEVFISIAIYAGLTSAIINPLDEGMIKHIYIAKMIAGKDKRCKDFINAVRSNLIKG